jgi:hypothetical protein
MNAGEAKKADLPGRIVSRMSVCFMEHVLMGSEFR